MVIVNKLSKIYEGKSQRIVALDNVSLTLLDSGLVFLLGKSGCGKTTFLNMLGAMDTFDGGDIVVDGRALSSLTYAERDAYRNTYVGFVFQEYNLIEDFNVEQNIAIAQELQRKQASPEEIGELLKSLDLEGLQKRAISELSGGQRQRVAIARALIKNPRLLLCDEPTGALDSQSGESLMNLLKKISRKRLVVVVSHDRDFAERFGDRIIELKDGKVISDSDSSERVKDDGKELSLTFARLKTSRAAGLGLRTALKRPVRFTLSALLLGLATFVLSMAILISLFNYDVSVVRTIINAGRDYNISELRYVVGSGEIVSGDDLLIKADDGLVGEYSSRYNLSAQGLVRADNRSSFAGSVYRFDDWLDSRPGQDSYTPDFTYPLEFSYFMQLDADIVNKFGFKLIGELPVEDDEIVITAYNARSFIQYDLKGENGERISISNIGDMIGKRIYVGETDLSDETFTPISDYTVCGVITNLDLDNTYYRTLYTQTLREVWMSGGNNITDEYNFLKNNYLFTAGFFSPAAFEQRKNENRDTVFTTGVLKHDAALGGYDREDALLHREDIYLRVGSNYNDYADYVPVLTYETMQDDMPVYTFGSEPDGDGVVLSLHVIFSLIEDRRIELSPEDAQKYGCTYLSDYIDNEFLPQDFLEQLVLENDFGGVDPGDGSLQTVAGNIARIVNNGEFVVDGVPYARLGYENISDVVEKYVAGTEVELDNTDSKYMKMRLAGVAFYPGEAMPYEYENGFIIVSENLAEELTYGAYGNYYDGIISPMPSSYSEVSTLWEDNVSRSDGVNFLMSQYESMAVDSYVNSSVGLSISAAALGGVMILIAILLIFNFITNSVALREKDIKILRNLGAGRGEICKIFYTESILTALISAVLAAVLTAVGAWLLNTLYASRILPSLVSIVFEWWIPLAILGITLLISFIVTLLVLIKKVKR